VATSQIKSLPFTSHQTSPRYLEFTSSWALPFFCVYIQNFFLKKKHWKLQNIRKKIKIRETKTLLYQLFFCGVYVKLVKILHIIKVQEFGQFSYHFSFFYHKRTSFLVPSTFSLHFPEKREKKNLHYKFSNFKNSFPR